MLAAMETQLVLFLALTSVTLITNAVLIWFVYRALSKVTSKVTETASVLKADKSMRTWIESMQSASEQSVKLTEMARDRLADSEQALVRAQEQYASSLAKIDAKLEGVADGVCTNAQKVRDAVAKPAFILLSFVSGLTKVFRPEDTQD